MTTMPSHDGEGELLVKSSRLRFSGDVVVPERTEKLENDEEEAMENILGQSMHGDHDGKVGFSIRGPDGPRNSHGMVFQKARVHTFVSLKITSPILRRPAAELRPSNAPLKVTPNTHSAWVLVLATTQVRFVLKNSARTPSCGHADALMQAVGGSPWHVKVLG